MSHPPVQAALCPSDTPGAASGLWKSLGPACKPSICNNARGPNSGTPHALIRDELMEKLFLPALCCNEPGGQVSGRFRITKVLAGVQNSQMQNTHRIPFASCNRGYFFVHQRGILRSSLGSWFPFGLARLTQEFLDAGLSRCVDGAGIVDSSRTDAGSICPDYRADRIGNGILRPFSLTVSGSVLLPI